MLKQVQHDRGRMSKKKEKKNRRSRVKPGDDE
jgi:hypothetical protein